LDNEALVNLQTILGPTAGQPLVIETPVYITHMSFGALSKEVKIALARGSAGVRTAMCSGEGGILEESMASAHRYIFEYVPNKYSATDENLRNSDAIEIKFGQSVKPGMGGHLPGAKVTEDIAGARGFPPGQDIISPSRFPEIENRDDLKKLVAELRERSAGRPIGIKVAAGHVEKDLEFALFARPDFITIDGRPGATGAAPKFVKDATSVPTIYALHRARRYLDSVGAEGVSLVITGGLRISADFIKALAMGADAVAIGTAALMACCCQQYRVCNSGKCPVGCTTQDADLRSRLNIDISAQRVENFLRVSSEELREFCRLTGHGDVKDFGVDDLCTTNSEISGHTDIEHV
jgi:glutamate synthase domain-containing protein 2